MSNKIIVAFDNIDKEPMLSLAKNLKGKVWGFKIGHVLKIFGPSIISLLKPFGSVFVDLKYFDIPETINLNVKDDIKNGADMISIHCRANYKPTEEQQKYIVGITYLTSENIDIVKQIDMVRNAESSKYSYIVCSGKDLHILLNKDFKVKKICPGIRLKYNDNDSHLRSSTPFSAIINGADKLVIGRPILSSKNPLEVVNTINKEIESAIAIRERNSIRQTSLFSTT